MCAGAVRCERLCLRSEHCALGLRRRRELCGRYFVRRLERRQKVLGASLEYVVEKGDRSYRVKATLAKTKDGWRLGGFRVHCY